jgi:Holliday junction resolvase
LARINSRDKGAAAERELAEFLRERGHEAKRGQQYKGSKDSPDVIHDIPGVHIECKRVENFSLYPALEQAIEDAGDRVPVVFHRRNRREWVVIMRATDYLDMVKKKENG